MIERRDLTVRVLLDGATVAAEDRGGTIRCKTNILEVGATYSGPAFVRSPSRRDDRTVLAVYGERDSAAIDAETGVGTYLGSECPDLPDRHGQPYNGGE